MEDKYYNKEEFLRELCRVNLPCSKPSYRKYLDLGVLHKPTRRPIKGSTRRYYLKRDVEANIERLRKFLAKKEVQHGKEKDN